MQQHPTEQQWQARRESERNSDDALSHHVPDTKLSNTNALRMQVYQFKMADASRNHPCKCARLENDDGDDETTNKYLTTTIDAADFSDCKVLKPRGIVIFGGEPTFTPQMPHDHFTTDKPKFDDHIAYYKAIAGLQKYTIWLNPTAEFLEPVVKAHNAMEQWAEIDDGFGIFAQKHLLLSDPPKRTVSKDKAWLAGAKAKISFKPDTWRWKAPPLLDTSSETFHKGYQWNLKLDLLYWLTLQAFRCT